MVELNSTHLQILSMAIFIVILWLTTKTKPSNAFPPGNRWLPLIGETLSFLKPHQSNSVGHFMEDRISRYGKIFSSSLLGREAIVSANVEFNRFVQNNEGKLFATAWLPTFQGLFGRESIAFLSGESHKRLRSVYLKFLCMKRLQTVFLADADYLASCIVNSWKNGSIISAKEESVKYSLQIMTMNTLSIRKDDWLMEMLLTDYSYVISAICSVPINFPGLKYWKALKARRNVLKILRKIMKDRITLMSKDVEDGKEEAENHLKAEGRTKSDYDLLDLLLMKRAEFSNEVIEDFIFGSIFAGHDSTSRAIAFMLYLLADSPQVVKRLQEEHLQIVKSKSKLDRKLSWEDYRNMEFSKCVVNETLRLSNVAPFIPRMTTEEVKYKGFVIPKGNLVVAHMCAVHLDPSNHDNPMDFNPWRWMGPNCEKTKKGYMAFGGGARKCPGENLALLEMVIFLHHAILNYEWEIADKDLPMHLPYLEFPKGLPLRVHATQRLND
ncbi:cytochrome P450 90B1-like isoform X2 [Phalaenopsis equestris]|uniref:cytochrome P450 90B1-like isoform X2 n=1 Tax=Phalaenopsis equestris TaxID=78828 RepID=UPI0009E374AF|nr:cytochrome P450 90B1-like isoform X2 [Phalaenopsis equestris]